MTSALDPSALLAHILVLEQRLRRVRFFVAILSLAIVVFTTLGVDPVSWTLHPLGGEESSMGRTRRPYPLEFREQVVALVRAGRTPEELSKEFEPSAQTIRNWVGQAATDRGERPGEVTTAERQELTRLRRENRQLKLEREILSKAAAWFARETDTLPDSSAS